MVATAHSSAGKVETHFAGIKELAWNMRSALQAMKSAGTPNREGMTGYMQRLLADNPSAFGLSTGWEPNAFDGKDADFVNKPGHDATGRYIPYVARVDGKVELMPLVDYEKPGDGDYYLVPKATGKDMLTEPYDYKVGDKVVNMTSFMTPVMIDGKFVGVVGVDSALDALSTEMAKLKPPRCGYVALLSHNGNVVSHPDKAALGKPLKDSGLDVTAWQTMIKNPEKPFEIADKDGTPICLLPCGSARRRRDVVYRRQRSQSRRLAKVTSLAVTSIIIIAMPPASWFAIGLFLANRMRKRLDTVIVATSEIARGKTDVDLSQSVHKDEIGEMARSLAVLRDATIAKTRLETEAERDRALTEAERRERAEEAAERERQTQAAVEARLKA